MYDYRKTNTKMEFVDNLRKFKRTHGLLENIVLFSQEPAKQAMASIICQLVHKCGRSRKQLVSSCATCKRIRNNLWTSHVGTCLLSAFGLLEPAQQPFILTNCQFSIMKRLHDFQLYLITQEILSETLHPRAVLRLPITCSEGHELVGQMAVMMVTCSD